MITSFFRTSSSIARPLISRQIQSSCIDYSAASSPLFKLRQKTGLAYNLCREALNKYDNNVNEAEAWLKAQAMAHGLQKAGKLRDRSAQEGLLGLALNNNNKQATILELNCETDFVARNQIFKDLATSLTEKVALLFNSANQPQTHIVGQKAENEFVKELSSTQEHLKTVDDEIVSVITKLGENIKIRRALHFKVSDENTKIFGQVHAQADKNKSQDLTIMTGRFGALIGLRSNENSDSARDLTTVGNRLCRHIIGYSPTYIELPDSIRKHLEEAEKQQLEEAKVSESKNEDDGENEEQSDFEDASLTMNKRDDWPSIMDQTLIMSDETTVREYCKDNEVSIVYFNRLECGGDT